MWSPFSRHSFRNAIRINSENSFICIYVFSMILTDPNSLPYFIIDDSRWNNLFWHLDFEISWPSFWYVLKFIYLPFSLSLHDRHFYLNEFNYSLCLFAFILFCVVFNSIPSIITSSIIICTLSVSYFHEALSCFLLFYLFFSFSLADLLPSHLYFSRDMFYSWFSGWTQWKKNGVKADRKKNHRRHRTRVRRRNTEHITLCSLPRVTTSSQGFGARETV